MKTNENLTPIQKYHVDQNNKMQGEEKWWRVNGQIRAIGNSKDIKLHGKRQDWWDDGRRWYIDTYHFKKGTHGTKIEFKYGK